MGKRSVAMIAGASAAVVILVSALQRFYSNNCSVSVSIFLAAYLIYSGMIAAWGISVSRRVIHTQLRRNLLAIVWLLLFWLFVRTCKHRLWMWVPPVARICWYCFYIPMILIPLHCFFMALYLGKPEKKLRRYDLLYAPAAVLIGLVFTNDFHQLAFRFAPRFQNWSSTYSRGIVYDLAVIWIVGLLIAAICVAHRKCRVARNKKRIWMPLLILAGGIGYSILYAMSPTRSGVGFIEMSVMFCAVTVGICESLIQAGLIPSNIRYRDFFEASPLEPQILDGGGQRQFGAEHARAISADEFAILRETGVSGAERNIQLRMEPIRGGFVAWQEDHSAIREAIEVLQKNRRELSGETQLIQEELRVKTHILHVQEQTRLYNLISTQTAKELRKIEDHLTRAGDEKTDRALLMEINVLGAYIKRRSNLILLAEAGEVITVEELRRCMMESMENLRVCGADCALTLRAEGTLRPEHAMALYDFFEDAVEATLSNLRLMIAAVERRDGLLRCNLRIQCVRTPPSFPCRGIGGTVTQKIQDDAVFLTLSLPEGREPT